MEFPKWFWNAYQHMYLSEIKENEIYSMYPPNQCDWSFKLTKINEEKWHVYGTRDKFMFHDWEYDEYFEKTDDGWINSTLRTDAS